MFCNLNWSFYDLSGRTGPGSVNGPQVNRIQYNYLKGGEGRELGQTSCMENPIIKMLIPSLDNKMKTTHHVKTKKNHKQREV